MRKQLLVVLLPLLVVIAAAETANTPAGATDHATLQKVEVLRAQDGISVEMTSRGSMTPKVSTLDSPARLLVMLPNTVAATSRNHLSVDQEGVKDVRIGMNGQNPPTTSVVIDLLTACAYDVSPSGDNKVVLRLHPAASSSAKTEKAPASIHRTAVLPVSAKPVASLSAPAAAAAAPADNKQEQATSAPNNFVFLEPSYKPKSADESDSAVSGPPARVVEAASKFVDRPEGNLLPAPSAAQSSQPPSAGSAIQPAVNLAAEQRAQSGQQPASGSEPKYTGEPISVNLKDVDLKDFFRLIHEISGLNVVLDPNVKGTLTIVLDDVPWDQALDIVLKNNDLARQLDGNILRIATVETLKHEADARRAQHEAEALAVDKVTFTRFLSYAHAKDLVITCKKFISQRGDVIADERTNAIIVTDVPSVIPNIDKLLTQ
ncbi:MAG: secretin and TonB N-terminal domain-containing protein, partial [Acidobacteriaceae bacterium]|nr:secretin and TonB N-terminal domain-containing protein [Acidobacteriaceae bacterium]